MALTLLLFILVILPVGLLALGAYWVYTWGKVQEARETTKRDKVNNKETPPSKKGVLS